MPHKHYAKFSIHTIVKTGEFKDMDKIYDIVIIGGGTAGMTSAIYGHRSGKNVLIIEKSFLGGQIITASEVENYPAFPPSSGYDFAQSITSQINDMGISRASDTITGIDSFFHDGAKCWNITGSNDIYKSRAVIIATGTEKRKLGLDGEEKFLGSGLSYCATCDGAFYKDKTAAVIGGGNSAMEEAIYLSSICSIVYLIYRKGELSGEKSLRDKISRRPNIQRIPNTNILSLNGKRRLEKIELSTSEAAVTALETDAVFIAIGQIPQNKPFSKVIKLDKNGYIEAGSNCHTSVRGIFAAGDCRTKDFRQLVTAAADGAVAAAEAVKYIDG